jgi:hypothetical protein
MFYYKRVNRKVYKQLIHEYNMETIKINGYSVGDDSVGIGACDFFIDLGLYPEDVSGEDRKFIVENILRGIKELHDNGALKFNFSDEINKDDWDYTRRLE